MRWDDPNDVYVSYLDGRVGRAPRSPLAPRPRWWLADLLQILGGTAVLALSMLIIFWLLYLAAMAIPPR